MLLTGIRVLDLTTAIAGPTATQVLADLGADVIKIEGPRHAERMRLVNTPAAQLTSRRVTGSSWFSNLNRNKLGVSLDLSKPEGQKVFTALVRISDVVVENYTLRVMPNFGLDYAALKAVNPAIIYIAMPGYGPVGPYKDYPSWGETIEATAGLAYLTGYEAGPPLRSAIIMPDGLAGLNAAFATVMCLHQRIRTGKGQHLVLSQLEGATQLVGEAILDFAMNDRIPIRKGNSDALWAPHGIYSCAGEDNWVAIAVETQEQWLALCGAMGTPEWCGSPDFETAAARLNHRQKLDELVSGWTKSIDKYEVMHRLQQAGVPAGAVLKASDLSQDPHLRAREFFWEYGEALGDETAVFPYPGGRAKFEGSFQQARYRAPAFGEHNQLVLEQVLGLSYWEVQALRQAEVVCDAPIYA
ncbi:MAG: CoA transferase [Chloroflexi bacterium]|nr:CoA transferase [Chloroflexota bacterium]